MNHLKRILDCGHHYLQLYCVVEVNVIIVYTLLDMYIIYEFCHNPTKFAEWSTAILLGFFYANVKVVQSCLDSINIAFKK